MTRLNARAVLIVGGSMAGVQAALDIANSGLEVYLVERSPFLEGDSAIFLEAMKHPNIQVLTQAEVTPPLFSPPKLGGMKGGQGDFQA